jgi:SnoaL-like domain
LRADLAEVIRRHRPEVVLSINFRDSWGGPPMRRRREIRTIGVSVRTHHGRIIMSNTETMTNAAIVTRGYQAFNEADIATLDELFADDATWTTPGTSSVAGTARGKEAVFAQFGRYGGETEGTFRAELSAAFDIAD